MHERPPIRATLLLVVVGLLAMSAGLAAGGPPATPEEARAFVDRADARLLELNNAQQRADWVHATYITDDTDKLSADANRALIAATMELAAEATRFDGVSLPEDVSRRLKLLKLSL